MESVRSESSDRDTPTSMTSEYDVFLSFRGPDARHGIVDHLYECMNRAGLRVFKDDEEIRRGEVIGGELERAIRSSRVYAVVFSRNYASSAWCLRELDMMVDLHGGSNVGRKIILPIFYGADPYDVKLRTELYREALDTHKDRHGHDVVKKWEEALKTVGGISGWDPKAIQGEGKFVQSIVQDIFGKLRIKDQSLPDHLTGIDDRVFDMLDLLDCDSSGVRLVVVHGMGGIGKTTIARVIFNQLHSRFEGSSFVSDVRETSKGNGGIEKLQSKLLEDILGDQNARSCNYDGEMIRRIQCKRVLLVLNDVDKFFQLEKLLMKNPEDTLGTGSRVIITTRDIRVCKQFVRPGTKLLHFYEMEKMDNNHALQLFSRHAFGTDEPPEDYLSLSKDVVETTGNLPLALVVIGRYLCCESTNSWKSELKKLKKVPQEDVFEILKVSYDGLGSREKEIFLDIACFREMMPSRYAHYLWEARDLYPESGVKVLINKSLIKINSDGEFWIHDQLRDMGREIIRSKSHRRLEGYTRLWDSDDALKIVLQKKVSKEILAMVLDLESITEEQQKLYDESFSGLSNLLYLHLKGKHKFIGDLRSIRETLQWLSWRNCNQRLKADFFKMSNLVVLKIQGGWRGVEKLFMPNLRVLAVYDSHMTRTPDVSCCIKLEIMVFKYCIKLKEIHHSVGKLESLTYMNLSGCWYLGHCEIRGPLDVSYCPLEEGIPEEIGNLSALEELDLSNSDIRFLPATVNRLTSLKSLNLRGCNMLQEIRGLPTSLTELNASYCPLEKGIPKEIGNLSVLERLDLSYSKIRFLPATVSQLTSLESLNLSCCEMLQELRGLPTSLKDFAFSWKTVGLSEEISYTEECGESIIKFSGDFELDFLSRLKTPRLSFPDMASVETHVEIIDFTLTEMELGGPDLLPNITKLYFLKSDSLIWVSNIGRLRRGLKSLQFSRCRALVEIPGLEQLDMLEALKFWFCPSICGIQDLLGLKRLKRVDIWGCSSLLHVPRVIDECLIWIYDSDKLEDFRGSYKEYLQEERCQSFDA